MRTQHPTNTPHAHRPNLWVVAVRGWVAFASARFEPRDRAQGPGVCVCGCGNLIAIYTNAQTNKQTRLLCADWLAHTHSSVDYRSSSCDGNTHSSHASCPRHVAACPWPDHSARIWLRYVGQGL